MEEQILASIIGIMIHYALTSYEVDLPAACGIKQDAARAKEFLILINRCKAAPKRFLLQ
jgi:hypothetical protein